MFDHVTPDEFGVPSNIMGRHNEEFFSMLGRIVALAAILEYKSLSSTSTSLDADRMCSPSYLCRGLLPLLKRSCTDSARQRIISLPRSSCWRRGQLPRRGTRTSTTCGQSRAVDACSAGGCRRRGTQRSRSSPRGHSTKCVRTSNVWSRSSRYVLESHPRAVSGGEHLRTQDNGPRALRDC